MSELMKIESDILFRLLIGHHVPAAGVAAILVAAPDPVPAAAGIEEV